MSEELVRVGERTNITGSRAFGQAMEHEAYAEAVAIGEAQIAAGAAMLDVCLMGSPRRDELQLARAFYPVLVERLPVPLVIDSLDLDVIALALSHAPAGSIVNSISLASDRRAELERAVALSCEHDAALVVSCIDDDGNALTAEAKLEVARRGFELLTTVYNMAPDKLIFDPLAFPLSPSTAIATVRAVAAIRRELTPAATILGISDVSFGMPPAQRPAVNAAFLERACAAGLTHAILNPEQTSDHPIPPELEGAIDSMFAPLGAV